MDSEAIDIDVQPDGVGRLLVRWRIEEQGEVDIAVGPTPAINDHTLVMRVEAACEVARLSGLPTGRLCCVSRKGDNIKFRSAMAVVGSAALLAVGSASASGAAPVPASRSGATIPLLTVGDTAQYTSLDIAKYTEANDVYGAMEGLLRYSPNGQPKPALAQSVSTPNLTTYIFHLRQGDRFWDGDEMTSADVVNALDYYRQPKSEVSSAYTDVKSIGATGPYTVVVTLDHPDAGFESPLCWESNIFEKKFQAGHPTTMGNPRCSSWAPGPSKSTAGTRPRVSSCRPTRTGGAGQCLSSTCRSNVSPTRRARPSPFALAI